MGVAEACNWHFSVVLVAGIAAKTPLKILHMVFSFQYKRNNVTLYGAGGGLGTFKQINCSNAQLH
jgi:hypothetical protein